MTTDVYSENELKKLRRVKIAKFFRCVNGHAEPDRGESQFEVGGAPWRPCKICNKPLKLTTFKIKSNEKRPPAVPWFAASSPRKRSCKRILSKLVRKLPEHFVKIEKVEGNEAKARVVVGSRRDPKIGALERRSIEIILDESVEEEAGLFIYVVGAIGWVIDVRKAANRLKLQVRDINIRPAGPATVKVVKPVKKSKQRVEKVVVDIFDPSTYPWNK